jgi:hypothetical protein
MPFAAVEVGKAVRRCVLACVTTVHGGRQLRARGLPSSACRLTSEAAAGHRSLSGDGFPVRALRSQPVAGSVALALNVGLVHASQRLQVGNHYATTYALCVCVLPLFCYPPGHQIKGPVIYGYILSSLLMPPSREGMASSMVIFSAPCFNRGISYVTLKSG